MRTGGERCGLLLLLGERTGQMRWNLNILRLMLLLLTGSEIAREC